MSVPQSVRESIGRMLANAMDECAASGANSVSMPDEYVELAAWLAAAKPAPASQAAPTEMSPEFTDTARGALLWVLWHHQGGSSPIGQPIRFALGMGACDPMNEHQVAEAKRWGALSKSTTADFHAYRAAQPDLALQAAFGEGWRTGVRWAKRDDLIADIGSPAYLTDMAVALSKSETLNLADRSVQKRLAAQWGFVERTESNPLPTASDKPHPAYASVSLESNRSQGLGA